MQQRRPSFVGLIAVIVAATILVAVVAYAVIAFVVTDRELRPLAIALAATVVSAVTVLLARSRHETAAAMAAAAGIWAVSTGAVLTGGGLAAPSITLQCAFVAIAALLLGKRAAAAALAVSLATVLVVGWVEAAGLLPAGLVAHTPLSRAAVLVFAIGLVGSLVMVAAAGQRRAVDSAAQELAERVAAEEELRRRVAELDALQEISQQLAGRVELRPAIDEACRRLTDLFAAQSVRVRVLDEADDPDEAAAAAQLCSPWSPATLCVSLTARGETLGVLDVVRDEGAPLSPREQAVAGMAADLLAAAVMNQRLHELETRAAATGERQRIARDLHDAVAQNIFAASVLADALPALWEQSPDDGHRELLALRRTVRAALGEMRTVLHELRPETVALTPLPTLLERLADGLAGNGNLEVALDVDGDLSLPPDVHVTCYRVAQEAFNNVGKYANAAHAWAVVRALGDGAELTVRDDGVGFDLTTTAPGMGLGIMRERAAGVGAQLAIESAPGRGTTVTLLWPGGET